MTISTNFRQLALPVLTTALLATANVQANDAPKVAVNGVNDGRIVYNGPVQLTGYAGDTDGIKQIYGTIQNVKNKLFFAPDGRFVEQPTRLPFKFNQQVRETNWTTNAYALPVGRCQRHELLLHRWQRR